MRTQGFTVVSLVVLVTMVLTACSPQSQAAVQTAAPVVQTVVVGGTPQTIVVTSTPAATQAATFKSKDPSTFTVETFGEPETLDPALDYETAGGEIIQNTYDFLVFYNKDKVNELVPMLATEVPSQQNGGISADGTTYTFKIRQGVKFHNGDDMKPSDVAYTFQRGILQGGTVSPQWLLVQPILGSSYTDVADLIDPSLEDNRDGIQKADPAKLKTACQTVTSAITADDNAGTVTFKLAQPWGPFLVTLANAWGGIQDQKWVSANGGWDGSCDTWQKFYAPTSDDLNKTKLGTAENGTGPYMLDHWTPKEEIALKANPNYWLKQPLWEGGPSGVAKVPNVIIKYVDEFSTRFAAFKAGDADFIIPGSREDWPQLDTLVGEVCDGQTGQCKPGSDPNNPARSFVNLATANRTDAFFSFKVDTTGGNNYIGSGKLDGNGIPPDFFNDIHVRKAFAYCFDYETYLKDIFMGEGKQAPTVMLPGEPGYDENAPKYTYDPNKCQSEFQASTWKSADGKSLWDTGFRFTIAFNTGNTQRQTIGQIFQADLAAINPNFIVEVTGIPWASFLKDQRAKKLPIFVSGWQEDIPDPHDWVVPYATPGGTYSGRQSLPKAMLDQFAPLITAGAKETDTTKRSDTYKQFNQLFYDNVPTILLAIGYNHHYEQRWVKGYYNNALYSQFYYYSMSKD